MILRIKAKTTWTCKVGGALSPTCLLKDLNGPNSSDTSNWLMAQLICLEIGKLIQKTKLQNNQLLIW